MPPKVKTELSLRHLPDLSDASLSFQIPPDSSSADFLLADNSSDLDFLCGADGASFATVAPTPAPARGPLKICDLTPLATGSRLLPSSLQSPGPKGPSLSLINDVKPPPPPHVRRQSPVKATRTLRVPSKFKEIVLQEPAISEARLESLRAEVDTLDQHHHHDHGDGVPMHVQPPAVAQCSVIPMLHDTAPKVKPRKITNQAMEGGGRNKNLAMQSNRMPLSVQVTKLEPTPTTELLAQSSSMPENENMDIDTESQAQVPPAGMIADTSINSDTTKQDVRQSTGGVADRLVSYSQKLMSSIGIYKSKSESTDTGAGVARTEEGLETQPWPMGDMAHAPSSPDILSGHANPLRLSEISPQKRHSSSSGHLSAGRREVSPMRPAKKRPANEEEEPSGSKRGKVSSEGGEGQSGPAGMSSRSQVRKTCTERNKGHVSRSIDRDLRWPRSNFPSARTKYQPKARLETQRKGLGSGSTSQHVVKKRTNGESEKGPSMESQSRGSGRTRVQFDAGKTERKNPERCVVREEIGAATARGGLVSCLEKTGTSTSGSLKVTRPVGFTFRLEARMEGRKCENEEKKEYGSEEGIHKSRHGIPDFKALHEAQEALMACRKEQIVPIVCGGGIVLNTEIRAREREKFDEMVRKKEEEIEREKEERRREVLAEEEREMKELRKRAIPKANEIPEWYADMPKKGGSVVVKGTL